MHRCPCTLGIAFLGFGFLAAVVCVLSANASVPSCGLGSQCFTKTNASGTFYAWYQLRCIDEQNGRWDGYTEVYPHSWADNATRVTHGFGVARVANNGNPRPCGPPTNCQASGATVDGSGFAVKAFGCWNNKVTYDKSGKHRSGQRSGDGIEVITLH